MHVQQWSTNIRHPLCDRRARGMALRRTIGQGAGAGRGHGSVGEMACLGRLILNMRTACALETMDSLSSRAARCCNVRRSEHSAEYSAAAFFSAATVRRFLLLADSASSLAASSGVSSDRGFFTGFFFFATGQAASGGSPGLAASVMVDGGRGKGRARESGGRAVGGF